MISINYKESIKYQLGAQGISEYTTGQKPEGLATEQWIGPVFN